MRNLKVTIRFDGRAFSGWQVQKNAPTVMRAFQDALEQVIKSRPDIKGCSRTDSGVSAKSYCVSFKTQSNIPCHSLVRALNVKLPREIAAIACEDAGEDFHARYSAKSKHYCYRILNSPHRDPFWEGLALHCPHPKDIDAAFLNVQAADFIGEHDFKSFQNSGSDISDTVREIYRSEVIRKGEMLEFHVAGSGFLYNMVRIMTGTLLDIAAGRIPPGSIPEIIAARERARAGFTAPPQGLMLEEVIY